MKFPFDSVVKMGQMHADHSNRDGKPVNWERQENIVFKSMKSRVG